MATLKDVLEHLVRHAEGYATPALRQEHLDALADLDGTPAPVPPAENILPCSGAGDAGTTAAGDVPAGHEETEES